MYNDLRQQTQQIESIGKETLGITNKIYKNVESEQKDTGDMCDSKYHNENKNFSE